MTAALRRATASDARGIATVHVGSWRAAYRGLMPDAVLDGLSVDEREAGWRHRLDPRAAAAEDRAVSNVWVAEVDGRVVGFASAGPTRDDDDDDHREAVWEIYAIYLLPERQGRGLGRALAGRVWTDARNRACRTMTLWVLETNAGARGFYEALKMRPDGARKVERIGGADLPHLRYRAVISRAVP